MNEQKRIRNFGSIATLPSANPIINPIGNRPTENVTHDIANIEDDDRRLVHISSDSRKIAETNLFQTPIDEIDAAARILESVHTGVDIDLKKKKNKNGESSSGITGRQSGN